MLFFFPPYETSEKLRTGDENVSEVEYRFFPLRLPRRFEYLKWSFEREYWIMSVTFILEFAPFIQPPTTFSSADNTKRARETRQCVGDQRYILQRAIKPDFIYPTIRWSSIYSEMDFLHRHLITSTFISYRLILPIFFAFNSREWKYVQWTMALWRNY